MIASLVGAPDAFYLTVGLHGVWHGVIKDFYDGGWQSIDFDGERTENLVIGGQQMTARLYRFEECDRFRKYKPGSFLSPDCPSYNANRTKMLICKQCEIEQAEKGPAQGTSVWKQRWMKYRSSMLKWHE